MKRLIIAIVMMIFAVTVASITSITLNRNVKSIISDIQQFQDNLDIKNKQQTKIQTESILKKWFKTEKSLKFVVMQDKIAPLTEKFNHIKNLNSSDKKELIENLREITEMLEIFISTEKPVIENIF